MMNNNFRFRISSENLHLGLKISAIALVAFYLVSRFIFLVQEVFVDTGEKYPTLKVIVLGFGAFLIVTISERIGAFLKKDVLKVVPEQIQRESIDRSAIYFASALLVWVLADNLGYILHWSLGELEIVKDENGNTIQKLIIWGCNGTPKKCFGEDNLKPLWVGGKNLFSILNTWCILMAAKEIALLKEDEDAELSLNRTHIRIGEYIEYFSNFFLGKSPSERPFLLLGLLSTCSLSLLGFGAIFDDYLGYANQILGLIDGIFGIFAGIVIIYYLYRAFYLRGYPSLSHFVVLAMLAAIITTVLKLFPYFDNYDVYISFTTSVYKITLLLIFLMLTITYFLNLLEGHRIALGRFNHEVDHRFKNSLVALEKKISRIEQKKVASMGALSQQIKTSLSAISELHEIIQQRGLTTKFGTSLVPATFIDDIFRIIWLKELDNTEEKFKCSLKFEGVFLSHKEASQITRLLIEVVYNIYEHSYDEREAPFYPLTVEGFVNKGQVVIKIVDDGKPFLDSKTPPKRKSYGRRFIHDTAKQLSGSFEVIPGKTSGNTSIFLFTPQNKPKQQ